MRKLLLCVLLLVATPALAQTSSKPEPREAASGGKRLANFELNDSTGRSYNVGKHIGKDVLVIAFWATWCKPCKIELAAVNKLYLKYKDQGMVFLAVSIDGPDSIAEVTNYKRKYGYTFPVLLDSETAILERYNPSGNVPFSMVIDRTGAIVEIHQGYNPGDEITLEKKLLKLLDAPAPNQIKSRPAGPVLGSCTSCFSPQRPSSVS